MKYVGQSVQHRFDIWGFLCFSHGWTWFWWCALLLSGWNAFELPGVVLLVGGGLGVPLGAVCMSAVVEEPPGAWRLWYRLVDVDRITAPWLTVAVLLLPTLGLAAVAVDLALELSPRPVTFDELETLLAGPLSLLVYAGFVLLLVALSEELGWRGYLLDRLQRHRSALSASLLVGIAWATWHAPLFLMVDDVVDPDFTPPPLWFTSNVLAVSVLYAWLYNSTNRSILAVVLFHFTDSVTGQLLVLSTTTRWIQTGLTVVLVVLVVRWWGPSELGHRTPRGGGEARSIGGGNRKTKRREGDGGD
ncbi:CPBP family intramembrane glutamic endopeptidase [Haloprofundus halobius]|uniref:CPBP family intramembrane glutamic endopeptidase n=1 Tax=Haloprofundus halobius TaxID=2876194 RepID=UPI001CCBD99B|nr:CPBP family intramembrane glutamic endopeptidase [Haloprofundus halobius]